MQAPRHLHTDPSCTQVSREPCFALQQLPNLPTSKEEAQEASREARGAQYWNADREWVAPPAAFVDAIHLRWSAVHDFSVALAEQLQEARQEMLSKAGLAKSGAYDAP